MYQASIQNKNNEVLLLTGNETVYQVIDIQGLNPPKAQINTTTIVGLDGAKFNSSKLETRNIVLMVKINGDVEENRLNLYNYFRTKEWCTFYYSNGSRDVFIEGYVESVECSLFSNGEMAQISIICPYPYFKSLTEIVAEISNTLALFVFPFSINVGEPIPISSYLANRGVDIVNASESESGTTISIVVFQACSQIEIKNISNGDDFILNYSFLASDKIVIDTNKGQKSVKLYRNNTISNIFSAVANGSTFFQLMPGSNFFTYLVDGSAGDDKVQIKLSHYNVYRGV